MCQDPLPNIVILNIEKDLVNKLDLDKMIYTFADSKTRKKTSQVKKNV